jgi:hypothetical protein
MTSVLFTLGRCVLVKAWAARRDLNKVRLRVRVRVRVGLP